MSEQTRIKLNRTSAQLKLAQRQVEILKEKLEEKKARESAIENQAIAHSAVHHQVSSPYRRSVNSASVYFKQLPNAQSMSSSDANTGPEFTPTPNQLPRK